MVNEGLPHSLVPADEASGSLCMGPLGCLGSAALQPQSGQIRFSCIKNKPQLSAISYLPFHLTPYKLDLGHNR